MTVKRRPKKSLRTVTYNQEVFIDNGTCKAKKPLRHTLCMDSKMHFSSLFRKGKKAFWKIVEERQEYVVAFSDLDEATQPVKRLLNTRQINALPSVMEKMGF